MVRTDSNIRTYGDLRGRKIPNGFDAQPTVALLATALFENAGLTPEDANLLPVVNAARAREDLVNGRIDAAVAVIGSGSVKRLDHAVGGVKCLSLNTDTRAVEKLTTALPVRTERLTPEDNFTCILEPIVVMSYDYFIYAHKDLDENIVYRVTQILHNSKEKLTTYIPAFRNFDPSSMNPDIGVPYHPGAMKFYGATGM